MKHNDYHHFQPNEDYQYKMYGIQSNLDSSTFGQGFTRKIFLIEKNKIDIYTKGENPLNKPKISEFGVEYGSRLYPR